MATPIPTMKREMLFVAFLLVALAAACTMSILAWQVFGGMP